MKSILENASDSSGYHYSTIWLPIVEEIQMLGKDSINSKVLYIFSDLRENSTWFSLYRNTDVDQLLHKPQEVEALFLEKAERITKTSNLQVVVVYEPTTREEDRAFIQMRTLYEKVFNTLEIPIAFVAHINTQKL